MSSREHILKAIKSHTCHTYPYPSLDGLCREAQTFTNPVKTFSEVLAQVGGRAVELPEGKTVVQLIAELYPNAHRVAWQKSKDCSPLPASPRGEGVQSGFIGGSNSFSSGGGREGATELQGIFDPDMLDDPAELNGTDLAIVIARLGVCENAACYIEQQVRHRALYFIAEALVVILRKDALVNNMHEAFERLITLPSAPFACFISGPSKTADIEQALVMGAHGARELTVILV